jgi:putative flippase GtrA
MAPGALLDVARRRWGAHGRRLRFAIAGGANTAFGLAIYPALLWSSPMLHRRYMLGLVIAQALSLCFAFAVYKIGVFRTRGGAAGEFSRFLPFYLLHYAANWAALPLLVTGAGIDPVAAQAAFSVVLITSSYFWHSRITFRTRGAHP